MIPHLMIVVLAVAGFATSTANAQVTWTVCSDGSCDFTLVNAAIDS